MDANYETTDLEEKVNPWKISYKKGETFMRYNSLY